MRSLWHRSVLCFALVTMAACASINKVELDKKRTDRIRNVALLDVGESQQIAILNLGGAAGSLLGPIGGAIDGSIAEQRSKTFAASLSENKLKMGPPMMLALQEGLKYKGIQVIALPDQTPKPRSDQKGMDYSNIQTSADAILHVWFGLAGYVSPPFSTNFRPWTMVGAQLLDSETKEILFYKLYSAGYESPVTNVENVSGCEKNIYELADKLLQDAKGAYAGITACHQAVAQRIISALR